MRSSRSSARTSARWFRPSPQIAFASFKREFRLGETLAGLATRIAAKSCAYTYAFLVNRRLGRPQGRIKDPWAQT